MALIEVVDSREAADITVHQGSSLSMADLLVHIVESASESAGHDELWHYVTSSGKTGTKICWVNSRHDADLLIHFVASSDAAGWQRGHRYQGRL